MKLAENIKKNPPPGMSSVPVYDPLDIFHYHRQTFRKYNIILDGGTDHYQIF